MTERERITAEMERWRGALKGIKNIVAKADELWASSDDLAAYVTGRVDELATILAVLPPEPKLPPPVLGHSYRLKHRSTSEWIEPPYELAQVGPHTVVLQARFCRNGWSGQHEVADPAAITDQEWRGILGQYCAEVEDVTPAPNPEPKPCPREVGRRYRLRGPGSGKWAECILARDKHGNTRMFITDPGESKFVVGWMERKGWALDADGRISDQGWKVLTAGSECEALDA